MYSFNLSRILVRPKASWPSLLGQPRLLRAIPSLLVLSTSLGLSAASFAGGLVIDSALRSSMGINIAAGSALGAGAGSSIGVGIGSSGGGMTGGSAGGSVGSGASANVGSTRSSLPIEQRLPSTGAPAADASAQGTGAVSPSAADRTAGSVRSMGNGAGTGSRANAGGAAAGGWTGATGQVDSAAVGTGARAVIPTR
ncbi:MAG: hypothetical protein JWP96_52 [Polaromonas sp.]|nr:hypothetical protein [Polaromonas sp.]